MAGFDGTHPLGETKSRGAEWAETPGEAGLAARRGSNSDQYSARETVRIFAVSPKGCTPVADWRITSGNCGNFLKCHLIFSGARLYRAVPVSRRTTSSWMAAASTIWAIGTDSLAAWPCAPEPGPKLMISMPSSA